MCLKVFQGPVQTCELFLTVWDRVITKRERNYSDTIAIQSELCLMNIIIIKIEAYILCDFESYILFLVIIVYCKY